MYCKTAEDAEPGVMHIKHFVETFHVPLLGAVRSHECSPTLSDPNFRKKPRYFKVYQLNIPS